MGSKGLVPILLPSFVGRLRAARFTSGLSFMANRLHVIFGERPILRCPLP